MDASEITIAVCGDSFCAASTSDLQLTGTGQRAHFSHVLEDQYHYKVMHLAHGGFSNVAIWFQIRHAIKNKVDVVVYNSTWSHRVVLNVHDRFNLDSDVGNFYYYDPHCQSSYTPGVGDQTAALISTTTHNIENSPFFTISKQQKQAVDLYLKHLHSEGLQTEMDSWMFEYWHWQIEKAGALAVDFKAPNIGRCAYDFSAANPSYDTPFHTDRQTQEQIAANIHGYIVDKLSSVC